MKKNKLIYLFAFMVFLGFSSCEDKLELNPHQTIDAKDTYTSEKVVLIANSVYERMQDANLFGADMNFLSELLGRSTDVSWVGTFDTKKEMNRKDLLIGNTDVRDLWLEAYYTINICNIVLKRLELIDNEAERKRVEAEMLATRGWVYFELVRFWGVQYEKGGANEKLGVPIVLDPVEKEEDVTNPKRSTVADVYLRVLTDLGRAESLFAEYHADDNGDDRKEFLNAYVVKAILARVHLQMGDYAKALIKADDVIQNGGYELVDEPMDAFNKSSYVSEYIFALKQSALSNAGESNEGLTTHYASLNGNGRGDMEMTEEFLVKFGSTDLRGMLTSDLGDEAIIADVKTMYYIGIGQSSNNGGINTAKYGDGKLFTPLIRLAEMYLIRAECNIEEGTELGDTPLNDINRVRGRAKATLLPAVDRDAVRKERYLELCWEGFRLHDLRRWKEGVYNPDDKANLLPYNSESLLLPIPEREMEANENLKQNDWYIK